MDEILKEMFQNILFAGLGAGATYCYKKAKDEYNRYKLKVELDKLKKRKREIRVIDLANGDPYFAKRNIFVREVDIFGNKKSLYIDLDEEHKKILKDVERKKGYTNFHETHFQADRSFNNSNDFKDLAEMTEIKELPDLINKHRKIVGEMFLNSKNGFIFNGRKYGIFNLSFKRFGDNEEPGAELELFETDYFTHRVFRSIYKELKEKNHPITQVDNTNFLKYRPFLTSFGINTLLICEGEKGKEIVLSKRSPKVHGNHSLYHITMNEGLSVVDKDPFGKIDLELCFKRGLLEELGIDEKLYSLSKRAEFYDFFLEFNNFEIGLSSVLEIELNFEKDIQPLIARDKTLETSKFITLPLKEKIIKNFVQNHNFIPHGEYVLERVLLRENIRIY